MQNHWPGRRTGARQKAEVSDYVALVANPVNDGDSRRPGLLLFSDQKSRRRGRPDGGSNPG
jgi:hypothetical protein